MIKKRIRMFVLAAAFAAALALGAQVVLADDPTPVLSISVTSGGSGYDSNTTITISAPDKDPKIQATAIPIIDNGGPITTGTITGIQMTNIGSGYTTTASPFLVTIADPGNTGTIVPATITATLIKEGTGEKYYATFENKYLVHNTRLQTCAVCHAWGSVSVGSPVTGSGYTSAPTVTIAAPPAGGLQATAHATVASGAVTFVIDDPGYGYTSPPTVTVTGSNTTPASFTATTLAFNNTTINSLNAYGKDLLKALVNAYASANLTGTSVSSLTLISGGWGYTTTPTVTISAPTSGTQATAHATVTAGAVAVVLDTGGSGYTSPPTVTIGVSAGDTTTLTLTGKLYTSLDTINAALGSIENNQDGAFATSGHGAPSMLTNTAKIWALTFPGNKNDGWRSVPSTTDFGGPHGGFGTTPDQCAACHRAHTSQAGYLLADDVYGLCTNCHDGTGAYTNVLDGTYSDGTSLKGGGFGSSITQITDVKQSAASGTRTSMHNVDDGTGTMWGNGAINSGAGATSVSIECTSCHDPHNPAWSPDGNTNNVIYQYRMLKLTAPADSAGTTYGIAQLAIPDNYGSALPSASESSPEGGTGTGTTNPTYGMPNYFYPYNDTYTLNVDPTVGTQQFEVTVATSASPTVPAVYPTYRINQFCAQCHTRYMHSKGLSASKPYLTPTGDTIFSYQHTTNTSPGCLTCHNAHGSSATMGTYSQAVPLPGGAARGTDSTLLRLDNRGVCVQCHVK